MEIPIWLLPIFYGLMAGTTVFIPMLTKEYIIWRRIRDEQLMKRYGGFWSYFYYMRLY